MKKNMGKKNLYIGGAIIIVIIIALAVNHKGSPKTAVTPEKSAPTEPAPVVATTRSGVTPVAPTPKAALPDSKKSYATALEIYSGKILQLDSKCNAYPAKSGYKMGTSIMIDNRSPLERKVSIGTQSVTITPYDFEIITLSQKGTWSVNCGDSFNVATITVQE